MKKRTATKRRRRNSAPVAKRSTIALRNFTGKVKLNPNKTVSVMGVGKRGGKKKAR